MEEGPGRPEEFSTVYVSLLKKILILFKCAAINSKDIWVPLWNHLIFKTQLSHSWAYNKGL